jgi:HAD superfamily hydrolase (TIGR01509 family)
VAYRALLLDLDNTLFDRTAAMRAWADATAQVELGRSLSDAEWQLLLEIDGRGHRAREEFAADARKRLGLAVDAARFGHVLLEHIVPEPGVAETLARLAETKRIAVVTNGGTAQRAKLARLGLDAIVHAVFVSGEVGSTKPALGIFDRAVKWTEQAPHHVLFVGDDPVIDLAPAASLGIATAWRARGQAWPSELAPPTHRIDSITELAAL